MKARFVVSGHSLLDQRIVKDLMPGIYHPTRAVCSCGAWCNQYSVRQSFRAWSREWHDEHKIEVLRSRGELEEE